MSRELTCGSFYLPSCKRNIGCWDLVSPDSDKILCAHEFTGARYFLQAIRAWAHHSSDIRGVPCHNHFLRRPSSSRTPSCTRSRRPFRNIYCDDYPGEFFAYLLRFDLTAASIIPSFRFSTVTAFTRSSQSRTTSWDYSLDSLLSEGPLSSPTPARWKSRQLRMSRISKRCSIG